MTVPRWLLAILLLTAAAGPAWAHATLDASEPASEAMLEEAPETVRLRFSEAVEVDFSRVELHRLEDAPVGGDDPWPRLHGRAGALASEVLAGPPSEDAVPAAVEADGARSEALRLRPEEPLAPGTYVVAWRVLAADGHATDGYAVFAVVP